MSEHTVVPDDKAEMKRRQTGVNTRLVRQERIGGSASVAQNNVNIPEILEREMLRELVVNSSRQRAKERDRDR